MLKFPSVFNDIIGPIMVGPSSSHTCGPTRIGYLSQQLLDGELKEAVVEFAREGAYTNMYKGHKSDLGFMSGLLGRRPENLRLRTAKEDAKELGVDITFEISDFEAVVPNISRITMISREGEEVVVTADSTGGGTLELLSIDGLPVSIVGDAYEFLIFTEDLEENELKDLAEKIKNQIEDKSIEEIDYSTSDNKGLINIKTREEVLQSDLLKIKKHKKVTTIKQIKPVLTVLSNKNCKLPFRSAEEMLEFAKKEDKELWEVGVMYEAARSGWSEDEVIEYMGKLVTIMEDGVHEALKGDLDMLGILSPTAVGVAKKTEKEETLPTGVLDTVTSWSIAVMEYSSAMGVVVCTPTGGSAGVIPGAILGTAEALQLSKEDKVKAMLATAAIGICVAKDNRFSAELYGCQVEPGAASAMAAGGLMYYLDGSIDQALNAASIALQNVLGIICDPVAGLVQVPCISRNVSASANAVTAANIAAGGFDGCIPLDEVIETMLRVGRRLPNDLKCTCNGGLCSTPTAETLRENFEKTL